MTVFMYRMLHSNGLSKFYLIIEMYNNHCIITVQYICSFLINKIHLEALDLVHVFLAKEEHHFFRVSIEACNVPIFSLTSTDLSIKDQRLRKLLIYERDYFQSSIRGQHRSALQVPLIFVFRSIVEYFCIAQQIIGNSVRLYRALIKRQIRDLCN